MLYYHAKKLYKEAISFCFHHESMKINNNFFKKISFVNAEFIFCNE